MIALFHSLSKGTSLPNGIFHLLIGHLCTSPQETVIFQRKLLHNMDFKECCSKHEEFSAWSWMGKATLVKMPVLLVLVTLLVVIIKQPDKNTYGETTCIQFIINKRNGGFRYLVQFTLFPLSGRRKLGIPVLVPSFLI